MTKIELYPEKPKQPVETEFYKSVHKNIKKMTGRMTPAQINGILFQIQLEVLDVFNTEEEGYTV